MLELTPVQMETVKRMLAAGLRPIAIPLYEKSLCMFRGDCAAVLSPVADGTFRLLAPATILINGNLSVRLKRATGDVFVWKQQEKPATAELLGELGAFTAELEIILGKPVQ